MQTLHKIGVTLEKIKSEHSIFALPFAFAMSLTLCHGIMRSVETETAWERHSGTKSLRIIHAASGKLGGCLPRSLLLVFFLRWRHARGRRRYAVRPQWHSSRTNRASERHALHRYEPSCGRLSPTFSCNHHCDLPDLERGECAISKYVVIGEQLAHDASCEAT
jgi:hypothetical protein